MDEKAARKLLATAVAAEPPMGLVAMASLRAGRRLRRRRLTRAAAGSVAVVGAAVIVVPAVLGGPGPARPGNRPAAWVLI